MTVKTIGIDLAKNIFQIHGVDERGNAVLKKRIKRQQLMTFFSNMAPCLIGMEACAGAHYWARLLKEQGHEVKLMALMCTTNTGHSYELTFHVNPT